MVHEMSVDRIEKWQCIFCGSRSKKIGEILSGKNVIGRSLICCNCGHVENFAVDVNAIPIYMGVQSRGISGVNITCGISTTSKLKCNIETCDIGLKEQCSCKEERQQPIQPKTENFQKEAIIMPKSSPTMTEVVPIRKKDSIIPSQISHSNELTPIKKITVGGNKYN